MCEFSTRENNFTPEILLLKSNAIFPAPKILNLTLKLLLFANGIFFNIQVLFLAPKMVLRESKVIFLHPKIMLL